MRGEINIHGAIYLQIPLRSLPRFKIGAFAKMMPEVTVLINSYNYASYLGDAIESALLQTISVNIVVVDDGSPDNSLEIAREYASDPRVLVISQCNSGQNAAVKRGLKEIKTEYVIILDSDDMLDRDACEKVLPALKLGYDLVQFRLRKVDSASRVVGEWPNQGLIADNQRSFFRRNKFIPSSPMSGNAWSMLFLDRAIPYVHLDRSFCDGFLIFSAAIAGKVTIVNESLGTYRVHGNNASTASLKSSSKRSAMARVNMNHAIGVMKFTNAELGGNIKLRSLIPAYTWRDIALAKAADDRAFSEFSGREVVTLGIYQFIRQTRLKRVQRLKNVLFLIVFGIAPKRILKIVEERFGKSLSS